MAKRDSKGGGGILSAGKEEAARELIWRANSALVERLLLWAMGAYFHAIGHDKLPGLGTYIGSLGVALEDLVMSRCVTCCRVSL